MIHYSRITYFFMVAFIPFALWASDTLEKKAVFIIGTGRCGSSCTAGLLNIIGLPLGDQLRPGHPYFNQKGFFEDIPTVQLTEILLRQLRATFVKPVFVTWDNHPRRQWFKSRIKDCLQQHFSTFPFFGIKNPIIALFLPLYCEAAQELGYTPKIVIIKRDLQETYASWHKNFTRLTHNQVVHAVHCYSKAIDYYTPHYNSLTINFNDIIYNTRYVVEQFGVFLPELKPYDMAQSEIEAFIDKNLKHHNTSITNTSITNTSITAS